jgi:hypothetical protein
LVLFGGVDLGQKHNKKNNDTRDEKISNYKQKIRRENEMAGSISGRK